MHKPLRIIATIFTTLFLAVACATTPPESIPIEERMAALGFTIGEQVKRIKDYRINGWSSVDRFTVIINVGVSMNYLVTVRNSCDGLRSAVVLAFSNTIGDLTDKDRLVVRGNGGYLEQCFIDSIIVLEKSD